MNAPRLSQRFDRIWANCLRDSPDLVYTRVWWTEEKWGFVTMNASMWEDFKKWSHKRREAGEPHYFKWYAEEFGLTSFMLKPTGTVELTADIPPRSKAGHL